MKSEEFNVIKCPKCEAEYLPGEIFYPKHFLGQPSDVERDALGKIIYANGAQQQLEESYVCDKCNTKFIVKANITYNTQIDPLADTNDEYTTKKYKGELQLEEN